MLLKAPNGAEVDAREDAVKRLLDAGFTRVEPEPKPAPKRRTATRKKKTDE